MKRLLTFLTLLTVFIGVGWAEEVTYTFTSNSWEANPANWIGTANGNQFNTSGTPKGVQVTTGAGSGATITCPVSYDNISKVEVTYSSSSNAVATISVSIGTFQIGQYSVSKSQVETTLTYTPNVIRSGVVSFTPNVTKNSIGINSVKIYYTPGGTTPTNYSLTLPTGLTGGTVSATGADDLTAIPSGTSMTVTATPNSGYELNWMKANGTEVTSPYTFSITENTTITAEFTEQSIPSGETHTATYIFNTDNGLAALGITKPASGAGTDLNENTSYNVDDVSMTTSYTGTSTRVWNASGTTELRVYNNGSITFNVPSGCYITGIEMTGNSVNGLSANVGSYSNGTWTGSATQSITFSASTTVKIHTITVTYTAPASSSSADYYLVGSFNMDGNNWVQQDVNYKFNKTGDNSYSLSAGNLPDDVEFKIIKVDGGTTTWYGGSVNNSQPYAIKSDWHTNIPLKENPNYGESIQNFKMSVGGISNFTLNTSDMTFSVEKTTPQFYFKSSADWTIKNAMTATADGWTITVDCAAGTNFGFNDEWTWYGRDNYWITNSTLGIEIDLSNDGTFYIENAGTYTFTVNSDKTKLVVTKLAEGDKYELITSTDDLEANHEYLVVGKTSTATYVMSKTLDGGRATRISVTPDGNGRISATDAMAIITLGGNSTDGWSLSTSEGYVASGGNGKMQFSSSAVTASIGFGAGDDTEAALIDFSNNTSYPRLKHNTSSQWFACYATNSGTENVYLYKKLSASNKSAAPVITPEGGNVVGYSQEVTITQANGGIIYYTTDGTTPTEASNQYNGAFFTPTVAQLGDEVTVTAVAKEDGKELSNPVSVTYKFVSPVKPTFTPAAGTYTVAQNVSMATTTEGADVYYTTNSELTYDQIVAQGTKFTEPINVSEETTYYAVAAYYDTHAERYAISSITQAKYKFAEVESVDLPYSHPFTGGTGFGEFTTLDVNNPDEITVWTVSDDFGAKGTSYINGTNYAATSWLLSPYINLSNANEPVFTFDHQINKHFSNPSTQATVWIRTYGGEWTPLETSLPTSSSGISGWPKYDEEYDLSAYNGQIVQIGFKYYNPTAGTGAGTWEIQNFKVVDLNQPAIEVNNIAEFMDNTIVPEGSKAKLLNPVVVLYHYQQYHNDTEGDYVNDYIWVKDESGYAIIYGKYLDVNYTNGDVIPAGFTATKFYYNVGRFYQMYYPEGLQPATEKALADPEAVTLTKLNSDKDNYNGHYVTIPKMRIKFSSGELVPYEYDFDTEDSYGGQRNFEIGDATLSISDNNKSIIGYNNFDNPWLETLDYPEYENTTSDYGDYNITGIFERYNGVWEFMPIIITPWEEAKLTLHDLCLTGVEGQTYTISNPLQVVYVDTDRKSVWVKDDNGQSIWSTSPAADDKNFAIDYAGNTRENQAYYDQSNWCQLVFDGEIPQSLSRNPIIKGGMIKGTFTNKLNPTLSNVVLGDDPIMQESSSYATNYYVARNFVENSDGYFFMNPKPQEYADIVWAIYNSADKTMTMPSNASQNPDGFTGSFKVDMSMNLAPTLVLQDGTQTGKGYDHFHAIIRLASTATSNAPMLKDRMPANTEYVVYPLDITQDDVPTGITDVNGKAIKSVKYVNVAGVVSDKPFSGVNIVVTEYTDGSRTTSKMLRK